MGQLSESKAVFYWDQPFLVGSVEIFRVLSGENFFGGLVDQPFQPAQSSVEMLENDG